MLRSLGFLTIGLFDAADPRRGHESTLEIIELGERLGCAWPRTWPPSTCSPAAGSTRASAWARR
jgi:hypothetical protein